ncbi:MAG: efflux RND transporter periplasmic adaptor subunit [Candidatus Sumerlaeia bacterium]|nr:efflux RND transporter periplasmic adaptor subunit [Candidatus Sumerlaeia bacterium]
MQRENKINSNRFTRFLKSKKQIIVGLIIFITLVIIIKATVSTSNRMSSDLVTFTVNRGDLVVDVLESGNIDTSGSQVIKSEVEGTTKIIYIVPEGTMITQKDVEEKKILVELDASELRRREIQEEIEYQSAMANYTDAKESYDIQLTVNERNLKQAELKVKFAKMDLDKYLGERVATAFVEDKLSLIDLVNDPELGGEALQRKRKLENEIDMVKEETARAKSKLEWTRKLEAKGYVTREELRADELALKQKEISLEQAITALELFKRYEIQKEAEKLRSDYEEAQRELEKVKAQCRAEISKAEARLKSTEARFNSQKNQLNKIKEQIEKCKIYATRPGLIVYAGSNMPWRDEQIKEGAQVRERQEIINIPNTSALIAKTKIHESVITRVREGQKSFITVDALPERTFTGKVARVAPLPDSGDSWLNPNLKVYMTDVAISGEHPELKPGMSAQVKIIINELKNVVTVPLQAVTSRGDERICFVMTSSGPKPRTIETGDYNDKFIEVKNGLKEGEKVVLNITPLLEKFKLSVTPTVSEEGPPAGQKITDVSN